MTSVRTLWLAAAALLTVSACSAGADTELGVDADESFVRVGANITGEVIYPDGDITVTLTRDAAAPVRPGDPAPGSGAEVRPCSYDHSSHTFACDTAGLAQSRYVIAVTDAAQPTEGTKSLYVAVTATAGYDPSVGTFGQGPEGYVSFNNNRGSSIPLTAWMPDGSARVEVRKDGGPVITHQTLNLDANGNAVFRLPGHLPDGDLRFFVTDGLWEVDYPLLSE